MRHGNGLRRQRGDGPAELGQRVIAGAEAEPAHPTAGGDPLEPVRAQRVLEFPGSPRREHGRPATAGPAELDDEH